MNEYMVLLGKREVHRPLGRYGRRWEYNITVNGHLWTAFLWLKMRKNYELLRKLY